MCFRCLIGILQLFHADVAKVDRDVPYVAMVVHVCCKRLFPMFHLFFRCMLQVCLSGCCICFTHMLQVFYLDVAYVCNGFQAFFRCFCSSVSSIFRRILQLLHRDVSNVDQVFAHVAMSPARACVSRANVRASALPLPTHIPCATPDLLLKHTDAIFATYKRRQMKHLKHASETLTKTPKNT